MKHFLSLHNNLHQIIPPTLSIHYRILHHNHLQHQLIFFQDICLHHDLEGIFYRMSKIHYQIHSRLHNIGIRWNIYTLDLNSQHLQERRNNHCRSIHFQYIIQNDDHHGSINGLTIHHLFHLVNRK